MDISSQEEELKAMIAEMKTDYNRDHFVRDEEFKKSDAESFNNNDLLGVIMNQISDRAQERGLTPEILESILNERLRFA